MAMLGKEIRMSRLVNPVSNKMMAITVDHATSRGIAPMTGIQDVQSAIDKIILGKPDAMLHVPARGKGFYFNEDFQLLPCGSD